MGIHRKPNPSAWFLALLLLLSALPASGQDAGEILRQVDANLMPGSFEAYRKLVNEEPDGKKMEYELMFPSDPINQRVAETLQAQLLNIGINTYLVVVDSTLMRQRTGTPRTRSR